MIKKNTIFVSVEQCRGATCIKRKKIWRNLAIFYANFFNLLLFKKPNYNDGSEEPLIQML
jgi:hypothetical protein